MKKAISAEKVLIDLGGKPIPLDPTTGGSLTVGVAMGIILQGYRGNEKGGAMADPLKCLNLARDFYKAQSPIELDSVDIKLVERAVRDDKRFGNLVLGQLLEALEEATEVVEGSKVK